MPSINDKLSEQIVILNEQNIVLAVLDKSSTGIDVGTDISKVKELSGLQDAHEVLTIPVGIEPPTLENVHRPLINRDRTNHNNSFPENEASLTPILPAFKTFSNQYLYLDDGGCGEFIANEEVEQSIHKIETRGRTGSSGYYGKVVHAKTVGVNQEPIKYAWTCGYFGGSADNAAGGTGTYLEISGSTTDHPFTQGITLDGHQAVKIQFWFHLDGVHPPDGAVLFGKKNPAGTTGGPFYMDYDAGTNKFQFKASLGNTGASFNKSVEAELPTGITVGWHHCQVERSNDQLRIFIDGVLKDQTEVTNSNNWTSDTNSFSIGAESDGTKPFKGYMSDFHYVAGDITGTDWQRIIDGPSGGTMATGAGISTPAEVGTGDQVYTKLLVPMHGICGCNKFVERGFNIVSAKATSLVLGGLSGSTAGDTGNILHLSNIGVTGAMEGFSADRGFLYGFSGTGGTGGVTGAGAGGTQGLTGSFATWAISSIPFEDIIGITNSRLISISASNDAMNQDFSLGVSGSTANPNNLIHLMGNTALRVGSGAAGVSGAGVSGGYFDIFNFKLTPKTYETLGSYAAAVESGLTQGVVLVDLDGTTSRELRPIDITDLYKDVSEYYLQKKASQQEAEANINSITDFKELADTGGKGGSKIVSKKNLSSSVSYKAVQSEKSKGTSVSSPYSNVYTGK